MADRKIFAPQTFNLFPSKGESCFTARIGEDGKIVTEPRVPAYASAVIMVIVQLSFFTALVNVMYVLMSGEGPVMDWMFSSWKMGTSMIVYVIMLVVSVVHLYRHYNACSLGLWFGQQVFLQTLISLVLSLGMLYAPDDLPDRLARLFK